MAHLKLWRLFRIDDLFGDMAVGRSFTVHVYLVWLNSRCGGSFVFEVAHVEMWWLIWRCGGTFVFVVALLKIRWLIWRYGGSFRDVVAQLKLW